MKKFVLILLLCVLAAACAAAEPAKDVTAEAAFQTVEGDIAGYPLRDRDENTGIALPMAPGLEPPYDAPQYLLITPGREAVAAAYIEFGPEASSVSVDSWDGDGWIRCATRDNPGYAQHSISFPPQTGLFRLAFTPLKTGEKAYIRELFLYTEGTPDSDRFHDWQPPLEKADILFVAAHPDDEVLWFGGAIPWCVNRRWSTQTLTLTCATPQRRLELLNGLWHCGVRNYPQILYLTDEKEPRERVTKDWEAEEALLKIVRQLRDCRPEVVVTHGLDGEYGHIQHVLCAELLLQAVPLAADEGYHPETGAPWQVKKLYLHNAENTTLAMTWDNPLPMLRARTGIQIAREAYAMHVSQQKRYHHVAAAGEPYDSTRYTLMLTTVGPDEEKNDFFEHIDRKN